MATNYLFRSQDLENWEYLHPFWERDRFTRLGDDGACPYFWPLGDRHILVFFSHLSGGQYLIGDYDTERDKFLVDAHGLFTFWTRVSRRRPRADGIPRRGGGRHRHVQHESGQAHPPDGQLPQRLLRRQRGVAGGGGRLPVFP